MAEAARDPGAHRAGQRAAAKVGLLLARCAVLAAASLSTALAATQFIQILAGGTNSVYYPLGVALAAAIDQAMPQVKTTVQATKGSADNLSLLQAGRGDVAFALGDTLAAAWRGNADAGFNAPLTRLRGIAALYPNYVQIVARADSGIRTLADLRHKTLSVGARGSATELAARTILAAAGLSYRDLARVDYRPFGESIELLKNRQVDASLVSASLAISALRDLASAYDVVWVPIPADVIKKMGDPVYFPARIPAGTYRGQSADLPTAAVENYLVTHEGTSDELIYAITRALWSSLDRLSAAHAAGKAIDRSRPLDGMPVPLHPGAQRYYSEIGVLR